MTSSEIERNYIDMIQSLLKQNYSKNYTEFQNLMSSKEYRKAYLHIEYLLNEKGIKYSNKDKKVDEDFYWEFIS